MKMNYLKLRGSIYWYQRRIPKALHHVLGAGVYSQSLNTKDRMSLERKQRLDDLGFVWHARQTSSV